MSNKNTKTGKFENQHGMSKSKIYYVWLSMRERCTKQSNQSYKNYGGRGIKVCDEWMNDFMKFYNFAISNGYRENLTLDRIDNNKNYTPDNCRFITRKEQNRNYRKNHNITYNGETLCLSDMADKYGINRATVLYRIKNGKTLDEVFNKTDKRFKK
jgi:hypothetical protein